MKGGGIVNARITVVKKAFHRDLIDEHLPHPAGQAEIRSVFEVEGPFGSKPDGFCGWATTNPTRSGGPSACLHPPTPAP